MTIKQKNTQEITTFHKIWAIIVYGFLLSFMFVGCVAVMTSDESSSNSYSDEEQIRKDAIYMCKQVVADPWNCNESNF